MPHASAPRQIAARAPRARCTGGFEARGSTRSGRSGPAALPRCPRPMGRFHAWSGSAQPPAPGCSARTDRADRAQDSAVGVVMPLGRERAAVHGSNVEHGAFPAAAAAHLQAALKREPAPPAEPRRLGAAALRQRARRC